MNEFENYLKTAVLTSARQADEHVGEGQIIAFYEGELAEAERESVQKHLVGCANCLRLLREVSDFFDPLRQDEVPPSEADIRRDWLSLWPKIKPAEPAKILPFPKNETRFSFARLAIAASLVASFSSTGYLAWRVQQEKHESETARNYAAKLKDEQQQADNRFEQTVRDLKQQNEQLIAEQTLLAQRIQSTTVVSSIPHNIQTDYFSFGEERDSGGGKLLDFSDGSQARLLVMTINNPRNYPSYVIELQDEAGRQVIQPAKLKPVGEDNTLNMVIARAGLKSGEYVMVLYGVRGQEKSRLGQQLVMVKLNR